MTLLKRIVQLPPDITDEGAIARAGDDYSLDWIKSVSDGYVLTWNSISGQWEPSIPEGGGSLEQVLAVGNITGLNDIIVSSGQYITGEEGISGNEDGKDLNLQGGSSYSTGGFSGGFVIITAGHGYDTAIGGNISAYAGNAYANADAGNIDIQAGSCVGLGEGGGVILYAGDSVSGIGGSVQIRAGAGDSAGDLTIQGGLGLDASGGHVLLKAGASSGIAQSPDADGYVRLSTAGGSTSIGDFYCNSTNVGFRFTEITLPALMSQDTRQTPGAGYSWTIKAQNATVGQGGDLILAGGNSLSSTYGGDVTLNAGSLLGEIVLNTSDGAFRLAKFVGEDSGFNTTTLAFNYDIDAIYIQPESIVRTGDVGASMNINAGNGTGGGGYIFLAAGTSTLTGEGGFADITAGDGYGSGAGTNGGYAWLRAGSNTNSNGGEVRLISGEGSTAATDGKVIFATKRSLMLELGTNVDGSINADWRYTVPAIYMGPDWNHTKTGRGCDMSLYAGRGTTGGGDFYIQGGQTIGTGQGGEINIASGIGSGTGGSGDCIISTSQAGGSGSIGTMYLCVGGQTASDRAITIAPTKLVSFWGDGYFVNNLDVTGKLTVGGLIDPTGLVLAQQASVPGGNPSPNNHTIWVRTSDGALIVTNSGGSNIVLDGSGSFTPPVTPTEDGYIPIASGGDFIYLGSDTDGYVLTWDTITGSWTAQPPVSSGTLTPPVNPTENGYIPIASDGDLIYLGSNTDGYVLTWDTITGAWTAQPPVGTFTPPVNPTENGYVAIASGGDLTYLGSNTDGYVLTWDTITGAWTAQPPASSGGLTPPVNPTENGYIPIASGGDFIYLGSDTDGYVLTWDTITGAWTAQPSVSGTLTPPINPTENGYVAIASGGDLTYLGSNTDGYVLTWDTITGTWTAQPPISSGGLTPPVNPTENGYVPIASGGDFIYLGSDTDGYVLTWDTITGAWTAQPPAETLTPPVSPTENGYVAIASDGDLTYINAPADGYILAWNEMLGTWEPQNISISITGPTLAENGYVAIASGSDLIYIGSNTDGYVLTWNEVSSTWEPRAASGGPSANTLHDNVAEEFFNITEKTAPVDADLLIIEDSADGYNKKKLEIGNLYAKVQPHGLDYSPLLLYQFDGNSNDSSGNGYNLDSVVNTPEYFEVLPGLPMIWLATSNLRRSVNDLALEITGAITIEVILLTDRTNAGSNRIIVSFQNGATVANNSLWDLRILATTNKYGSIIEDATETARTVDFGIGYTQFSPVHIATVRESDGVNNSLYVNGELAATGVFAAAPSGGTTSKLQVGANDASAVRYGAGIASLKVVASALTAAQIKAEYNRTLGRVYGIR